MKRMLDMTPRELTNLNKEEFLYAIASSEGRVMVSETIGIAMPMLVDITNAELASAMGADILILNLFDFDKPIINGLKVERPEDTIRELKRLTGRAIGINLEPVDSIDETKQELWAMSKGRAATVENAKKALEMGVDFIVLTGNPGNKVTNEAIASSLKKISSSLGDKLTLVAGKMHSSGIPSESGENIITKEDVDLFIDNGADIVLLPAPGTVPGLTTDYIHSLIKEIHKHNKLALTSIGTSQEGADIETVKRIALESKIAGADLHHIGDSGYMGMSLPENIFAYSVAIRGVRHTYRRMAMSLER